MEQNKTWTWTPEERLAVVRKIAVEIAQAKFPDPGQLMDWSDRLAYLVLATPEFLDANLNHIVGRDKQC